MSLEFSARVPFISGQTPRAGDDDNTIDLISGFRTGGDICIFEHDVAPGMLTIPHRHRYEDQIAYVVRGTIGYRVGEQEFVAQAGQAVYRPRGMFHTNWNPTGTVARMLEITVHCRIEDYFAKKRKLLETGTATDEDVAALRNEYGIEVSREWVPEMEQRLGVKCPDGQLF